MRVALLQVGVDMLDGAVWIGLRLVGRRVSWERMAARGGFGGWKGWRRVCWERKGGCKG